MEIELQVVKITCSLEGSYPPRGLEKSIILAFQRCANLDS